MKHIFLFLVVFCGSINGAVPEQIVENIEYILSREKKVPIIAIGGCPGVGKSTFATSLLQELSEKNIFSIILSIDDFGKTQEEKKGLRNELDIMRIRWNDLDSVLKEIKVGNKKIKVPKINQLTKERAERTLNLDEIDLILFEGMYTLSNTDNIRLHPYVDLGIYMETTTENISVPAEVRRSMLLWVGCIAGALEEYEYVGRLARAGFDQIDIEPTRIYNIEDARQFLSGEGIDVDGIAPQVEGKFMSAFIRAVKPLQGESRRGKGCCGPSCCS